MILSDVIYCGVYERFNIREFWQFNRRSLVKTLWYRPTRSESDNSESKGGGAKLI